LYRSSALELPYEKLAIEPEESFVREWRISTLLYSIMQNDAIIQQRISITVVDFSGNRQRFETLFGMEVMR